MNIRIWWESMSTTEVAATLRILIICGLGGGGGGRGGFQNTDPPKRLVFPLVSISDIKKGGFSDSDFETLL